MILTIWGNSTIGFNVTVVPYDATDLSDYSDNITTYWGVSSNKVNSLGSTASSEEATEMYWGHNPKRNIGSKDEDHRTKFGIKIMDPESMSSGDEAVFHIPGDQVTGIIDITGERTTSTGTPTTQSSAPTPVTADEINNKEAFNLVLVGGPCVNSLSAEFLGVTFPACGAASGLTEDTAIIELKENGDKMALVVAGWEAPDTRRAGVVLANYEDFELTGTSATVTGTSIDVSAITVA
jgi:hypothetical protein